MDEFTFEKYKKAIKTIGEPPKDDDPERDRKWLEWYDAYHAETTWFLEGLDKELREKYAKLCETRIENIADDAVAFFIEELLDQEPEEILG